MNIFDYILSSSYFKMLYNKTALDINKMIKDRKISAVEVTQYFLNNIKKRENYINAYTYIYDEIALKKAKDIQAKMDSGIELSPIAGVPMAIKDNICVKNTITSCGSKMLSNFVPPYNATVVEKLEESGAIILGKLNMDEFAMGNSTETSFFGVTKNPWNLEYVSGGSSGGSAAAVASDEALYTLGSDTGGSIRQPSSFCGVSGIKPTYGTVSRYGLVSYASSLEQIGPIAKDIIDCAYIFDVICGNDYKDSVCFKKKAFDFQKINDIDVSSIKIGVPQNCFENLSNKDIEKSLLEALKIYQSNGVCIEKFDIPLIDYAVQTYYIIACAEASSNLSRYDGIRYGYKSENNNNINDLFINSRSEGFGKEVKYRIMLGSFVLSSGYYEQYYKKALKVRRLIKNSFDNIFKKYDIVLTPTTPDTAFKIGENSNEILKRYSDDIYTVSPNLVGLPAASIPCGFDSKGLPIGMQIIGNYFNEEMVIKAAHIFQSNTDFHLKKPKLLEENI